MLNHWWFVYNFHQTSCNLDNLYYFLWLNLHLWRALLWFILLYYGLHSFLKCYLNLRLLYQCLSIINVLNIYKWAQNVSHFHSLHKTIALNRKACARLQNLERFCSNLLSYHNDSFLQTGRCYTMGSWVYYYVWKNSNQRLYVVSLLRERARKLGACVVIDRPGPWSYRG